MPLSPRLAVLGSAYCERHSAANQPTPDRGWAQAGCDSRRLVSDGIGGWSGQRTPGASSLGRWFPAGRVSGDQCRVREVCAGNRGGSASAVNDPNFNHPQQPVVAISWFEAVRYCEWLSGLHGGHYRLPTEAEWERAARGGVEGELFPWGDAPPESLPDYGQRWSERPRMAVARRCANRFGLCDTVCRMCTNGAAIGFRPTTMGRLRNATLVARSQASAGRRAVGRGATTLK